MKDKSLYYCATQVLAGDTNSTCLSERMHSPAGRICNEYRASMHPDTVERLIFSLRKILMRSQVTADITRRGVDAAQAELDAEDLLSDADEEDNLVALPVPRLAGADAGTVIDLSDSEDIKMYHRVMGINRYMVYESKN